MTEKDIYDIFYNQMAIDYSCTKEEIKDFNNYVKTDEKRSGTRAYKKDNHIAKMISLNGKFVLCVDERIKEEADKLVVLKGEWMSLGQNTEKLNEITRPYGYISVDEHHYYLPTGKAYLTDSDIDEMRKLYKIKMYERDEIERFRGDSRFTAALSFCEKAPDMLAFTAEADGEILGMSGASADSDTMWQIGINVSEKARGMNIGPFLTILLKEEILRRGKLPFYGTGESHIQSQRVAIKSGFFPTWWESYSYKITDRVRNDI